MIRVQIPASFEPERRYIVGVMLGEFLGLEHVIEVGPEPDYILEVGSRRLVIRDQFFSRVGDRYLDERNIPAPAGSKIFGDDLFAAAFFMLTRWEETVSKQRDPHGRFLAKHSLAMRAGFLDRCVVDEWVDELWTMLGCPPRRTRAFTVSASHDVDYPWLWTMRTGVVTFAGDILKRRSPRIALQTVTSFVGTRTGLAKDPYDTFDWLMDRSDESNVRSTFNFMSGRWTEHDPPFEFDPRALAKIMRRIDRRGHVIGFHPSYNAYADPKLWKLEYDRLATISPQQIAVGREHYLRFAAPTTWQIWDDAGMEWDSTLGYADHEGFRCGTCHDYPVFNVETRRQLKLRERPLIAMDATLVGYRKLSPEGARASLAALRAECKKHRGDFTLLWHNSNLGAEWLPYRDVYREALRA